MKHAAWLVFVPALLAGCYGISGQPKKFPDKVDIRQNKAMYVDGLVLTLGLRTYMTRHDESPPAPATWIAVVSALPYLPHGHFPANPWTTTRAVWDEEGSPQQNVVPVGTCNGLGTAYDDASPIGTVVGPGEFPGNGPATCRTYGTFLFSATRGGARWVLYGIGRSGDQAIVRFVATQADTCCE
jgi:hypothetical protein